MVHRPVELDGRWHLACRGDYVIRPDSTAWLQACHDAGFTGDQAQELRWYRIRLPLMGQEDADRRELNSLLDELARRQRGDTVMSTCSVHLSVTCPFSYEHHQDR
ncbi:hypothetical protein L8S23_22940 [Enterobacter bugandensis]|uniref:hypothetical protein n=1 Tax=Enterobacter bugandensis TaxID=881260 RepID=UPI0020030CAD|nr:hypothetical protein [Enterobacter bugandensis]MCK6880029.1 hypothetical protein [Enterobacter bugandensis]